MMLTTLTLLVLADVAPLWGPKRPPRPPDECSRDTDCVLSTFQGCCGSCCAAAPHAIRKGLDETKKCAIVDCAPPNCAAVRCMRAPDVSSFVAACESGQCVARPKNPPQPPPPAPVCRVDEDCRVVRGTPAPGACCGRPIAQSIDAPIPLQRSDQKPSKKKQGEPAFGLSTGNGASGSDDSSCPVCPPLTGVRAVCSTARQCVIAPTPPPPG